MKAIEIINKTSTLYHSGKLQFDMNVIPYISDKFIRQEIISITTNKKLPANKCTETFTINSLRNFFEQPKLF